MTQVLAPSDDDEQKKAPGDPGEAPETPSDEPQPVPVKEPPATPERRDPYVVGAPTGAPAACQVTR